MRPWALWIVISAIGAVTSGPVTLLAGGFVSDLTPDSPDTYQLFALVTLAGALAGMTAWGAAFAWVAYATTERRAAAALTFGLCVSGSAVFFAYLLATSR